MDLRKTSTIILSILFCMIMSASATYITLTQTVFNEKIILGNESSINITLANSGDEAAYDVQLTLLLPDGMTSSPVFLGRMDPNMPQKADFNITIKPDLKSGRYSYAILTEYKDANGYPFSSVSPYSLYLREQRTTQTSGVIAEQTIGTKGAGKISLDIMNRDDKARNLLVTIYGPKELKITPMQKTINIGARSEAKTDFDISSFGALAGSSYVVFAAMDYDDSGIHYSSTATGIVKVVEKKDEFSLMGYLPIAIVALLILALVYYQFKK